MRGWSSRRRSAPPPAVWLPFFAVGIFLALRRACSPFLSGTRHLSAPVPHARRSTPGRRAKHRSGASVFVDSAGLSRGNAALAGRPRAPGPPVPGSAALAGGNGFFPYFCRGFDPPVDVPRGLPPPRRCGAVFGLERIAGSPGSCATAKAKTVNRRVRVPSRIRRPGISFRVLCRTLITSHVA
ncbi:hypothetical protein DSECCO2_580880 [anaerobic digester metagenome]|jgi:hypothetical protein